MCGTIPALKDCRCSLVTDKKKAITNAVKEVLPSISHAFCWNHILRHIRYWLCKHGALAADIAVYLDVRSLFHSASEEVYSTWLAEYRDAQFEEYCIKEIHPDVTHNVVMHVEARAAGDNQPVRILKSSDERSSRLERSTE